MREWFKAGAEPAAFPSKAREDKATLIVISETGVVTYATGPYAMPIECEQIAFGTGRDYAEAAMYLGRTATEGVRIACHFQVDCGNGCDSLDLVELDFGQVWAAGQRP